MKRARIRDLVLPNVYRDSADSTVVKVDRWGGRGLGNAEGEPTIPITQVTGTLTLFFDNEVDATETEGILRRWAEADDRITIETANGFVGVMLTNQRTGDRVGTRG